MEYFILKNLTITNIKIKLRNMNLNFDEMKRKGEEIRKKMEELHTEILNDPNIPQDTKDEFMRLAKECGDEKIRYVKYLEENKDKKIIGYNPENFEPIFEK